MVTSVLCEVKIRGALPPAHSPDCMARCMCTVKSVPLLSRAQHVLKFLRTSVACAVQMQNSGSLNFVELVVEFLLNIRYSVVAVRFYNPRSVELCEAVLLFRILL